MIRNARPEDVVRFPEIERAAGAAFGERGMASIADDEPLPAHELLAYQRAGRAWVAADDIDEPIAYLVLDIVDESPMLNRSRLTRPTPTTGWDRRCWTPQRPGPMNKGWAR